MNKTPENNIRLELNDGVVKNYELIGKVAGDCHPVSFEDFLYPFLLQLKDMKVTDIMVLQFSWMCYQ